MNKHPQRILLSFAVVTLSLGTFMTLTAFGLQAQLFKEFGVDKTTTEDETLFPAAVGEGFSEVETSEADFMEDDTWKFDEEFLTTEELDGSDSSWEEAAESSSSSQMEEIFRMENQAQSGAPSSESSTESNGTMKFYRDGKEVPVIPLESAPVESSSSSSSSSVPQEDDELIEAMETGALLGTETDSEEGRMPMEESVPQKSASLFGAVMDNTIVLVGIAALIGGAMYFFLLRKKKPSAQDSGPVASPDMPTPAPANVEQTSPRLEQALKAIEAQHSTPPATIPQEGSSPSSPAQASPA